MTHDCDKITLTVYENKNINSKNKNTKRHLQQTKEFTISLFPCQLTTNNI